MRLQPSKHPKGTRLIVISSDQSYDRDLFYEVTILEWSPKLLVKLQYETGNKTWLNKSAAERMVVIEVLPKADEVQP